MPGRLSLDASAAQQDSARAATPRIVGFMSRSLPEALEQAEELADWFEEKGPSPDNQRPVEEYYLEYVAETRDLVGADMKTDHICRHGRRELSG